MPKFERDMIHFEHPKKDDKLTLKKEDKKIRKLQRTVAGIIKADEGFVQANGAYAPTVNMWGQNSTTLVNIYSQWDMTVIAQGDLDGQREGNTIKPLSVDLTYKIIPTQLSTTANQGYVHVRVLLIQYDRMGGVPGVANSSTYPAYEEIFQMATSASMTSAQLDARKSVTGHHIHILYDKTHQINPADSGNVTSVHGVIRRKFNKNKLCTYNGTIAGIGYLEEGAIQFLAFNDNVTVLNGQAPVLAFNGVFRFEK